MVSIIGGLAMILKKRLSGTNTQQEPLNHGTSSERRTWPSHITKFRKNTTGKSKKIISYAHSLIYHEIAALLNKNNQ